MPRSVGTMVEIAVVAVLVAANGRAKVMHLFPRFFCEPVQQRADGNAATHHFTRNRPQNGLQERGRNDAAKEIDPFFPHGRTPLFLSLGFREL